MGQYGGSRDYYNYKRMGGLVGGTVTNNNLRIEYCTNNGNVFSQLGCRTAVSWATTRPRSSAA